MQSYDQKLFTTIFLAVAGIVIVAVILFKFGLPFELIPAQDEVAATSDENLPNRSYSPIPSIGASPDYGADFKTYTSQVGFSFKYPPHFKVLDLLSHVVLKPVDEESSSRQIVISVGINDENMTAEEWFLSPDSGYLQSKDRYGDYYKTTIDGQDAVYIKGGMWTVVNTPDGKMRLSIATTEAGWDLFSEMGIVIESLAFGR